MKHIPRQALRVNPNQRRFSVRHVPHFEHHALFHLAPIESLKPEDAEMPKPAGKIRLGNLSEHGLSFHYNDRSKYGSPASPSSPKASPRRPPQGIRPGPWRDRA